MRDTLTDIRAKLVDGHYVNEEHVRLSLVARILQGLGWDIWSPREVNTEFVAAPDEDKTKVDVALFLNAAEPSIFIEVKAPGKIRKESLPGFERQLRDYNRNNTALISILTDGQIWRFYYSQTGGDFSGKKVDEFDIGKDNLDDVAVKLQTFLGKDEVAHGKTREAAEKIIQLSKKEQALREALPEARRLTNQPPFPRLPDSLVQLVARHGFEVSCTEAESFIASFQEEQDVVPQVPERELVKEHIQDRRTDSQTQPFGADQPPDLRHTSFMDGFVGSERVSTWNDLMFAAVREALKKGQQVAEIRRRSGANVVEGRQTAKGFRPIADVHASVQYVQADRAWTITLSLAKWMNLPISARFRWQDKDGAAHPRQEGILKWAP
jgi:hypothetical protein